MTSHQPPQQPTATSHTPAATRSRYVQQPNGDVTRETLPPPAACTACGVLHHAEDLLLGRCEECEDHGA